MVDGILTKHTQNIDHLLFIIKYFCYCCKYMICESVFSLTLFLIRRSYALKKKCGRWINRNCEMENKM